MWPVLLSPMLALPRTNSAEAHRVEPRLFVLSSGRSVEVFELLEVEVEGFAAGLAECQAPNPSISGAFLNSHDSGIVGHVDHHALRVLSVALEASPTDEKYDDHGRKRAHGVGRRDSS